MKKSAKCYPKELRILGKIFPSLFSSFFCSEEIRVIRAIRGNYLRKHERL